MSKNIAIVGLAVLTLLFAVLYFTRSPLFGANATGPTHYQMENFLQGLQAGTGNQFSVTNAGVVTTGKTLTVTTSNTATSTITVGCIQSYATSTATALALRFTASTTAPTNGSGVIPVISYGTCP